MATEGLQAPLIDQIKGKHLLVDGDIYAYRCAASAEKTKYAVIYLMEGFSVVNYCESHKEASEKAEQIGKDVHAKPVIWSRKEVQPLEFALQACKTALDSLFTKLNPSKVSVFLSPDRTFRHDLARTRPYKGNRTQPKPKYLQAVKDFLVKNYGATYGSNVEADDKIGMALSSDPIGSVSVSIDKDLLQVPGWHYNWVNDTVHSVSARLGDFAFYSQLLCGDATDNVPGCPGVGAVGAVRILQGSGSSKELCSRVWGTYRDNFDTTEEARRVFFEQAALLWILRRETYNEVSGGFVCPIDLFEEELGVLRA